MKVSVKYWRSSIVVVMVGMALLMSTPAVFAAANPNPGVLPPQSHPHGKTYGEWSNAWWQWALSIPLSSNPVFDTTGQFCSVGQSGSIWFLAGVFGSGTVTRNCTVPAGKTLFFPIWNTVNVAINADCTHSTDTVATLRAGTNQAIAAQKPTTYQAQVDGESISNLSTYRAGPNNPSFNFINLSVDTVNQAFGIDCAPGALNAPPYLAVSDGYYLMLTPRTPGQHTIHFVVPTPNPSSTTPLDVTYNLTVQG